jgi:hypothetical protein
METLFICLKKQHGAFQEGETVPARRSDNGYTLPDDGMGNALTLPFSDADVAAFKPSEKDLDGKCFLTRVSNFFAEGEKNNTEGVAETGEVLAHQVQLVHYPGSQQIIFHMPKYAWDAGEIRLLNTLNGEVVERKPVREKLSGSTQILWDTYPLQPGFYTIEANWPDGWTHRIQFVKRWPGYPVAEVYTSPPGNITMVQKDHEYRLYDANGVEMDGEMQIREKAMRNIKRSFSRRVEYGPGGRGGNLYYVDAETRIEFWWEFGGGDCIAFIDIPNAEQWEKRTGTPISERDDIVAFVAETVLRDQVSSGGYFKIGESDVSFWGERKG